MKALWTVGHSNRELADFLALLAAEEIEVVADVRRFPGSRRYPQFGRDALSAALREVKLSYIHFPALGGRRTKRSDASPNTGWRVAAFAAYADYMLTDEFARAFDQLSTVAMRSRTAIMCAEALPWQCHRRLVADQLIAQDWAVWDIIGLSQVKAHALPPFAVVLNGQVTYPVG